jgi:hypothetical protein
MPGSGGEKETGGLMVLSIFLNHEVAQQIFELQLVRAELNTGGGC